MTVRTAPADAEEWAAFAVEHGWSDGLPVVAPTRERVEQALTQVNCAPDRVLGKIPPSNAPATVEKVAANTVLAGCAPALLPLVVTAVEAICDPDFGLAAVQATTNPAAIGLLVNGPARFEHRIGFGGNCLGGAQPANVQLARAVRLVVRTLGCGDETDAATQGQPAKLGLAWAEHEDANPWAPLHVERGFAAEASTVTAIPVSGTQNMLETTSDPSELLAALARSMCSPTGNDYMFAAEPWLVLCPEHATILARAGWSKAAVRDSLWRQTTIPVSRFSTSTARYRLANTWPDDWRQPDFPVPISRSPDGIAVVVAGGIGCHSTFIPTIGVSRSVTKEVACSTG